MKNLKLFVISLVAILFTTNFAMADGVGYIDYQKVVESTPFARDTMKSLDYKALEL